MRRLTFVFLATFLVAMPMLVLAAPVDLRWVFEHKNSSTDLAFTVRTVEIVRDTMRFNIVVHNKHPKNHYTCFYVNANSNSVIMDDEFGDEYNGAELKMRSGQDNKLGPNQRKQFQIVIPAPKQDVSMVNVHFGMAGSWVNSDRACNDPSEYSEYQHHMLDWDVSSLRQ